MYCPSADAVLVALVFLFRLPAKNQPGDPFLLNPLEIQLSPEDLERQRSILGDGCIVRSKAHFRDSQGKVAALVLQPVAEGRRVDPIVAKI